MPISPHRALAARKMLDILLKSGAEFFPDAFLVDRFTCLRTCQSALYAFLESIDFQVKLSKHFSDGDPKIDMCTSHRLVESSEQPGRKLQTR